MAAMISIYIKFISHGGSNVIIQTHFQFHFANAVVAILFKAMGPGTRSCWIQSVVDITG